MLILAIWWAYGLEISSQANSTPSHNEEIKISLAEKNLKYISPEIRDVISSRIQLSDINYLENTSFEKATVAVNKSLDSSFDLSLINNIVGKAVNYCAGPQSTFLGGKRFNELPPFTQLNILGSYFTGDEGFSYNSGVIVYNAVTDKENGEVIVKEKPSGDNHAQPYLLSSLLKTSRGNCATMPVVFVMAAQRLGLPVKLVTVGDHQFCRYDSGKVKINIETTNPKAMGVGQPDSTYLEDFKPNKMMLENSTTMKSMNYRQSISSLFVTKTAFLQKTGASQQEIEKAVLMSYYFDPESIYAVNNMISIVKNMPEMTNRDEIMKALTTQGYRIGAVLPTPQESKDFENLISDIYGSYRLAGRQIDSFKREFNGFSKKLKELQKEEQKYAHPNYSSVETLYPGLKQQEALNKYHRDLEQKRNKISLKLRQLKFQHSMKLRDVEKNLNNLTDNLLEAKKKGYLMDRETSWKVDNIKKSLIC